VRDRVQVVWTLYKRLSGNVIREICDYLQDRKALIAVEGRKVLKFSIATLTWQPLFQLPQTLPLQASLLYISHQQLFLSGGFDHSSQKAASPAFLLSPGGVELVGSMTRARQGHALLLDSGEVLVFGGTSAAGVAVDAKLKVCERSNLQGNWWKLGREMVHARAFFTLCRHSCEVYLCGGGTRTMESFNLLSSSFTLMPFQLCEESPCLSVVQGYRLTVLTQTSLQVWDLRQGQRISSRKRPFGAIWSTCPPIVRANLVYLVDFGICKSINLHTGTIVTEIST